MANPTTWLIYPRLTFTICRTPQILISLTFLIINLITWFNSDLALYNLGLLIWAPLYASAFIFYLSTLIAYVSNPTRLSRVLDPHNPKSKSPINPLPNTPNLSRHGATLTIVIVEFFVILSCLGTCLLGIILGCLSACDNIYAPIFGQDGHRSPESVEMCKSWLWGNVLVGNVVLGALGIVMFRDGVKVYRAGWRESCRKDLEREVLSRMGTERNKAVSQIRENYGSIELRDIGLEYMQKSGTVVTQ